MSKGVPISDQSSRPLKVTVVPAPGIVVTSIDPHSVSIQVPVARVPITQLLEAPVQNSDSPATIATTVPLLFTPVSATGSASVFNTPVSASDVAALPNDVPVLKQMIVELLRTLREERRARQEIEQRLDVLTRRLYGPRPEPVRPEQPSLFPDDPVPPSVPHVPPEPTPPTRRGQCRPHGRRRPARQLRREERRYELTAVERLCPECGQDRQAIGVETTEQYDYKPAEVFVVEHQQVKYACKCCQGQVVKASKPPQPIDKGLPSAGLLAQIVTDKYQDHLPLYRMEQRFQRLGVTLPRSTMCDWMASCAQVLLPLWELLKKQVLQSKVLHTDDTTVRVRDETLGEHRYGRLWDYIGDAKHPGVLFDYTTTHARDGPATFLKGFQGFLQADAYGAYDGIYTDSDGKIIEVGCWAHARKKFAEAEVTDPVRALAAKAWIRRLYDVEDEAKKFSADERLRLRQEKSQPLLQSLNQWLLAQRTWVLPKSPIATAINYVLNQWEALNRYTTDGDLHIDNNISERTLKLIGIGRINWLFLGSDAGGRTAAVLFSFTATCKHLGIDTFAYLRDVFERLPTHPAESREQLLPDHWQAARLTAASNRAVPAPA
jgi:transposase